MKSTKIDIELGERLREAREKLPKSERSLAVFSEKTGLSQAYLSQIESGKRPIPVQVVMLVAELTGVKVDYLLSGQDQFSPDSLMGFAPAIDFLKKASDLGVVGCESKRDLGLFRLIPFLRSMRGGLIDITASTLRGLTVDPNNAFVAAITELKKRQPEKVTIRVLFTHLQYACMRETLENRAIGGIVDEVVEGIRWAHNIWDVPIENMRFVKAAPNSFTIFCNDGKHGLALLNPYMLMQQAYTSFTMLLETSIIKANDTLAHNAGATIYEGLYNSNFRGPWHSNQISVSLQEGAKEITESKAKNLEEKEKDAVLKAATKLKDFLDEVVSKNSPPQKLKADLQKNVGKTAP